MFSLFAIIKDKLKIQAYYIKCKLKIHVLHVSICILSSTAKLIKSTNQTYNFKLR